jgi:hypothetical protein
VLDVFHNLRKAQQERKTKHIPQTRAFTHPLLESGELTRSQAVSLADDWDDIDSGGEAAHELNVHLAKTGRGGVRRLQSCADAKIRLTHGLWEE